MCLTSLSERIVSFLGLPTSGRLFCGSTTLQWMSSGIIQALLFLIGYVDFEYKDISDSGISVFYL